MKLASLLCAVALVATSPPAQHERTVASAKAAYTAEQWADAAQGFQAAYEADPQLDYLFAWAQAERLGGQCEHAIALYTTYLELAGSDEDVKPDQLEKVAKLRELCTEQLTPEPPPPLVVTPPPTTPPPADAPHRRWYADPWGGALVGVGTGVLLVGTVARGLSVARSDDSRLSNTEGAFESEYTSAQKLGTAGVVLLATGAVVLATGVVRWIVLARRDAQ